MSDHDDSLLKRLASIDPTRIDTEPHKGSSRYNSILEAAMNTGQDTHQTDYTAKPATRSHWRSRLAIAAAATVVIAAVTSGIVLSRVGQPVAYAEVIQAAATNLGQATTLRSTLTSRFSLYSANGDPRDKLDTYTMEVEGTSLKATITEKWENAEPETFTLTIIGDRGWQAGPDGSVTSDTLPTVPEARLAPFTEASKALLDTVVAGAGISDLGKETVRDRPSTHYRLDPTSTTKARLAALPKPVLNWFFLTYVGLENVTVVVDVWVADGQIVRVAVDEKRRDELKFDPATNDWEADVEGDAHTTTIVEFYDYGADIHVVPPSAL
jgi:hypothetical protein